MGKEKIVKERLWLIALRNDDIKVKSAILIDYVDLVDYVEDPDNMTPEEAALALGGEGWDCDGIVIVEVIDGNTDCLPIGCELREVLGGL